MVTRLIFLILLIVCPQAPQATESFSGVAFFKATRQEKNYKNNPGKYERLVITDLTGKTAYFVERRPTYVIPRNAIETVIVRKTKEVTATGEPVHDRGPITFNLTFKLKPPAGKTFSAFTQMNKQSHFAIRVNGQLVTVQQFDLPFEPNDDGTLEFKIFFDPMAEDKFREMVSPFKNILVWD